MEIGIQAAKLYAKLANDKIDFLQDCLVDVSTGDSSFNVDIIYPTQITITKTCTLYGLYVDISGFQVVMPLHGTPYNLIGTDNNTITFNTHA